MNLIFLILQKNSDLSTKLETLATKAELKAKINKIVNLQAFDSSYFRDKSHFQDDGIQNYLAFHTFFRQFTVANTGKVTVWKSKGLSDENIKPPSISDNSINPGTNYFNNARI